MTQKLLAWDTSSKTGAIGAIEWDPAKKNAEPILVAESVLNVDATHSERLMWAIHQVLESCKWKIKDVDYFGVGVGPGSFTGLRIGVTTARTLAHSLGKPLIGISSLAALARPVALRLWTHAKPVHVIACTDACKGELFTLFGTQKNIVDCVASADGDYAGLWKRGVDEAVWTPEQLITRASKKLKETAWVAVGEGVQRYPDLFEELPAKRRIELGAETSFLGILQGRTVARLAWEGVQAGIAREALAVHPRYLRASDAEIKLKAGLLPKGPTRGTH